MPQLYLKVAGCWTGGHEENLRLAAVNLNHGPSNCEWWGLDYSQAPRFREMVKRDFGVDIYLKETLWWPEEKYCLNNGFNLYKGVQKQGDLVLVGCGTIHWVRSVGVTVNSAWNIGPIYMENFVRGFNRDKLNEELKFQSIVPMYTLALDLINNTVNQLNEKLKDYLMQKVFEKFNKENEILYRKRIKKVRNKEDNVLHCENCKTEILRVYFRCEKCYIRRIKNLSETDVLTECFYCMLCKASHRCKNSRLIIVEKFTVEDLEKLRCRRDAPIPELQWTASTKDEVSNMYISKYKSSLPVKRSPPTSAPAPKKRGRSTHP